MALTVELVSPERIAFSGESDMVIPRVADGDIAFQPGHVPFIGSLATHEVRLVNNDGTSEVIAVHQGFVEVANDRVTILSDVAELASNIDVPRAERAQAAAQTALNADPDDADAAAALKRAEVRLAAVGRLNS